MFFVGILFFPSCRPQFTQVAYFLDYQQAGNGKFFISESNSVSFEYEPIGSILIEELPGEVKITTEPRKIEKSRNYRDNYDDIYSKDVSPNPKTKHKWQYASAQSALNYAVDTATELGGDGLINVKLSSYIDKHNNRIVQISGMVIKRK